MSDDVKEKLRELIGTQGQQILSDCNKFTSLMLDLCLGRNGPEIDIPNFTFAGVQPFLGYKDDIFNFISTRVSGLKQTERLKQSI